MTRILTSLSLILLALQACVPSPSKQLQTVNHKLEQYEEALQELRLSDMVALYPIDWLYPDKEEREAYMAEMRADDADGREQLANGDVQVDVSETTLIEQYAPLSGGDYLVMVTETLFQVTQDGMTCYSNHKVLAISDDKGRHWYLLGLLSGVATPAIREYLAMLDEAGVDLPDLQPDQDCLD